VIETKLYEEKLNKPNHELALISLPHPQCQRQTPCSFRWFIVAESTIRWFVVREKYY
jgi:hypothetical protein